MSLFDKSDNGHLRTYLKVVLKVFNPLTADQAFAVFPKCSFLWESKNKSITDFSKQPELFQVKYTGYW